MRAPAQLPRHRPVSLWVRGFLIGFVAVLVLVCVAIYFAPRVAYSYAKNFAESAKGQDAASRGLGKTIKVDGHFAPLHVEDWKIQTDSFDSVGWPGEAIGGLNAKGIEAEFDPDAVWQGAWKIKYVNIAQAQIKLVPPVDALKGPPGPKKPRPWYLFFLPSRIECGPIICPNTELLYYFQGHSARISEARVQADLIGKDLKYTATSGTIEMPYFPPLHIKRLEMLVTRPRITVYTAQLEGLNRADHESVALKGTIGMREDKTVQAEGEIAGIPIEQILPEDLRNVVHGRATGHVSWNRDSTGQQLDSDGAVSLDGARLDDLSIFKQLVILHGNADLANLAFDTAACEFHLHGGHAKLTVRAVSAAKLALNGTVDYDLAGKRAQVDLAITDLPLKTWLPDKFKPGADGMAQAHLQWQGELRTIRDSSGHVTLQLDGGTIRTPELLRHLLVAKKLRAPEDIQFKTATMDVDYADQVFTLKRGDFDLPGIITAQMNGTLDAATLLNANVAWQGLSIDEWLPPQLTDEFSGAIQGNAKMQVRKWKFGEGGYAGQIRLAGGQLSYTPFQRLLARFLNDRGLLELSLSRAEFNFAWSGKRLEVSGMQLRSAHGRFGVRGGFIVAPDQTVSGALWIGTKPDYVRQMGGLGDDVFLPGEDGLRWAKVRISGTVKKPKQDLAAQILAQAGHHPGAIFTLGFKGLSWYIGNWFGADKEWERPARGDVTIKEGKP